MKTSLVVGSTILAVFSVSCADTEAAEGKGGDMFAPLPSPALVIANGGSGTVSVVDPATSKAVSTISVSEGLHPHHIGVSPDRTQLLISAPSTDLSLGHGAESHGGHGEADSRTVIYRLDVATGELKDIIEVEATAHNATFTSDGANIVFSMMEHGMIAVHDAKTFVERFTATGLDMPLEVTPASDQLVLVAESGAARIAAVDLASRTVVERFDVGAVPVAAWSTGDANFFVSSEESSDMRHLTEGPDGLVIDEHVIDAGGTPGQAVLAPGAAELWVAIEDKGLVAIFDASTHARLDEIAVGLRPHAITFDPDGSKAYVTDEESGKLFVIDAAARAVASEIELGGKPNAVVWIER